MEMNEDAINQLKEISAFVDYAHKEYGSNRDYHEHSAKFGTGILQAASIAVLAIGIDPTV